jgi:hypothetical protein
MEQMDDSEIELIAKAIRDETDRFECPVRFYIEPEAKRRWESSNPDSDWFDRPDPPDDLESYRIIARAAADALARSKMFPIKDCFIETDADKKAAPPG